MESYTGHMASRDARPAVVRPQDRAGAAQRPLGPVSDEIFSTEAKLVMVVAPVFTFLLVTITLLLAFGGLNLTAHVQSLAVKSFGGIAGVLGGCQLLSAAILGKYYHDQQKVIERRKAPVPTPPGSDAETDTDNDIVL